MLNNVKINENVCIGSGLVALDVVMNGNPHNPRQLFAGGSCGNVITILSYLKWKTLPIARLKDNKATERLLLDLEKWKVDISLVSKSEDGSTPIIIHRIKRDKEGKSVHRFEFKNPDNGKWLPRYKPVLSNSVESIIEKSPIPSIYYFDRLNRSSVNLAKYYKTNGSIIFFEPSSLQINKQLDECLEVVDIIKFSNDRIKDYSNIYKEQRVPLEIETFGKDGLQYRFSHKLKEKKWKKLNAYSITNSVDGGGSGDWFSAGLISQIASKGSISFTKCDEENILKAIRYGQALAALNCFFDGARGMMYILKKKEIDELVEKIQKSKSTFSFLYKPKILDSYEQVSISALI